MLRGTASASTSAGAAPFTYVYAAGVLAFILVILNPENGFAEAPGQVSFVTAVSLFVAFGLFSVAFWAFFQLRGRPAENRPANA